MLGSGEGAVIVDDTTKCGHHGDENRRVLQASRVANARALSRRHTGEEERVSTVWPGQ